MPLTPEQQAIEYIGRAKQILLITKEQPDTDAIAAMVTMGLWLQKLQKNFDAVIPGFDPKQLPSFLPASVDIKAAVGAMRAFHLKVKVDNTQLSELMYDVKDGVLDVTLVPKQGEWTPQDFTFKSGDDHYDLVIAIHAPHLHALGTVARDHANFFYRTPIINLDFSPLNESWGQVNIVNIKSASTTETLYHWFRSWNDPLIDANIATALLAGLIANTKGFRTSHVTPHTLEAASHLMSLGAEREKIVHGLWRQHSIAKLKLWGRVLSRLNTDKESGLVWSVLTETDFLETQSQQGDLSGMVDELIAYAPEAKVVVVFLQKGLSMETRLYALPPYSALDLARPFGGQGSQEQASFSQTMTANTTDAIAQIIERLRAALKTN